MVMKPTEGAPEGGAGAGSVGDAAESLPRLLRAGAGSVGDVAESLPRLLRAGLASPDDAGASRAANAVAYAGGALVLLGSVALALVWLTDLWATTALLGIVGAVVLVSSWVTRRLRPPAVSDVLAGVAAIALSLCVDAALDASGIVFGRVERWVLLCAPIMLNRRLGHWCCSAARSAGGFVREWLGRGPYSDGFCCLWRWRPAARRDWELRCRCWTLCRRSRSGRPWR